MLKLSDNQPAGVKIVSDREEMIMICSILYLRLTYYVDIKGIAKGTYVPCPKRVAVREA